MEVPPLWCCITDRRTFDHVTGWLRTIGSHVGDHVVRMIVGNKSDLREGRVVEKEEGEGLALEHNVGFAEVSAKDGEGVEEAFTAVVERVMERGKQSLCDDHNDDMKLPLPP